MEYWWRATSSSPAVRFSRRAKHRWTVISLGLRARQRSRPRCLERQRLDHGILSVDPSEILSGRAFYGGTLRHGKTHRRAVPCAVPGANLMGDAVPPDMSLSSNPSSLARTWRLRAGLAVIARNKLRSHWDATHLTYHHVERQIDLAEATLWPGFWDHSVNSTPYLVAHNARHPSLGLSETAS